MAPGTQALITCRHTHNLQVCANRRRFRGWLAHWDEDDHE